MHRASASNLLGNGACGFRDDRIGNTPAGDRSRSKIRTRYAAGAARLRAELPWTPATHPTRPSGADVRERTHNEWTWATGVAAPATGETRLYDSARDLVYDKPALRGWLHLLSFVVSVVVGIVLITNMHGTRLTVDAVVYATAVAGLFGASSLYHRGNWSPAAAARLQRLDHVMIVTLIAGSATPVVDLCVPAPWRAAGLLTLWTLAAAAIAARLFWMSAPEPVVGAIYIGLGWIAGGAVPAVWITRGVTPAVLLVVGGVLYTLGALGYHQRRPDRWPAVFGYHEVFHAYVTVAAAYQYVAIAYFVL